MPHIHLSPFMTVNLKYLWQKSATGPYWFKRRVPAKLTKGRGAEWVQINLHTRDTGIAARKIRQLVYALDAEWQHRLNPTRESSAQQGKRMLSDYGVDPNNPSATPEALDLFFDELDRQLPTHARAELYEWNRDGTPLRPEDIERHLSPASAAAFALAQGRFKILASECRDEYVKARAHSSRAKTSAEIPFKYLLELFGDRPIDAYRRTDVNAFVQHLLAGRHSPTQKPISTTTIERYITTLKSAWAYTIREHELDLKNPWAGVEIPRLGQDAQKRDPFRISDYKLMYAAVDAHGLDELRCILTLVAETGARLAEIVGLAVSDCHIDDPVAFIRIQPHPWRRLKTVQSARRVPLTYRALAAARTALERRGNSPFLFPRYTTSQACKATSVSNALNKWVRGRLPEDREDLSVHSLRHGMRDLLREVRAHASVADQLQGWETEGQGAKYGAGYSLEQLKEWLDKAVALHAS